MALAIGSCSSSSVRTIPAARAPAGVGEHVVAVAADSPEEFQRNVDAAIAAGKDVRVVTIVSASGTARYSPYAQIVRSRTALIVQTYGRVHVYRLSDVHIAYPHDTPFAVANVPEVAAPLIDEAVVAMDRLGRGANSARTQSQLCGNCFIVLKRRTGTKVANPWPTMKDPWQTSPDYVFWKPGMDVAATTRSPQFAGDPLCYVSTGCGPYDPCPPIYGSCVYVPPPYIPYDYFAKKLPPASWNFVAERACRQQGGRYADFWDLIEPRFYCQHVTDDTRLTVLGGNLDSHCFAGVTLPAFAEGLIGIIMTGNTLTPDGATDAVGVRVDLERCKWQPGN